jgi:deoxycytidine triphosphate deaminase
MSIKPDHWIKKMVKEHEMIEPFEALLVRDGKERILGKPRVPVRPGLIVTLTDRR